MKKPIFILAIISVLSICYYLYYLQSDKIILKNFANAVVDDSISVENILTKYVKYTEKGKKTTVYFLNLIKNEYKKNPERIMVYTKEEEKINKLGNHIKIKNTEKLYYIKFNNEMTYPFLINKESKIIVLFILTKGEQGVLSNCRSDQ
jgi:hypothetical protein